MCDIKSRAIKIVCESCNDPKVCAYLDTTFTTLKYFSYSSFVDSSDMYYTVCEEVEVTCFHFLEEIIMLSLFLGCGAEKTLTCVGID